MRACCTSAAWLISARETSLVAGYSDERRLVELKTSGAITAEHVGSFLFRQIFRRYPLPEDSERLQLREAPQLDEARMLLHVGTLGLALLTPSRRLSPVASQLSQRACSPQMIGSMDRLLDTFRSPDPSELPGVCTHCYPQVAARPQALTCATGPIVP